MDTEGTPDVAGVYEFAVAATYLCDSTDRYMTTET